MENFDKEKEMGDNREKGNENVFLMNGTKLFIIPSIENVCHFLFHRLLRQWHNLCRIIECGNGMSV